MKTPKHLQSFYTTPIFIGFAVLIAIMVLSLLSFLKTIFYDKTASIIFATGDLCQLKTRADIALNYGVGYQIDQDFDMPAIKITAKPDVMHQIDQDFEKIYPNKTGVVTRVSYSPKPQSQKSQCHLPNARYNAQNVNPRLAQFIPDDVDYVSYAPNADKAVYCYYNLTDSEQIQSGSQCFFIQIKEEYGEKWLVKDDITDLERANLEWAKDNYSHYHSTDKLRYVYTYVDKWQDKPNLLYGVSLATNFNGTRWLAGGNY